MIKNTIILLLGNNLSNKIHTLKDILSQKIKRKVFYLKRKTKKIFFLPTISIFYYYWHACDS